jgi:hypothetical protein
MKRKNAVDWSKYLETGEQLQDVPAATLRKRRHDSLGGTSTSKTEKRALLKREAKQAEYAKEGKLLDEALFAEMKQLEEHAKENYEGVPKSCGFGMLGVQWGSKFIPTSGLEYVFHLIQSGGELLRACNWHKLSSDELGERRSNILDDDQELPYESQRYYPFYAACMLDDIISVGHGVRLTKQLSDFLVKLMQAYVAWSEDNGQDEEYHKKIVRELDQRLAGIDTYVERDPIAVEPKQAPVVLHPQPTAKTYSTGADMPASEKPPTLQELAIQNYIQNRNWVEGEEI